MESLAKLRVVDLRERLRERGLSTTGTKAVLVERLQQAGDAGEEEEQQDISQQVEQRESELAAVRTPSRSSRRLSGATGSGTPLKASRRLSSEQGGRPSTPVRKSRRLSGCGLDPAPAPVAQLQKISETSENRENMAVEQDREEVVLEIEQREEPSTTCNITKSTELENKSEERPLAISEDPAVAAEEKGSSVAAKENIPMSALLSQVMVGRQLPRQKPKSGKFWKGERKQFRAIKRDRGQRATFEQRLKMKQEKMENKKLAEFLSNQKNAKKEELRKKIEENKAKKLENEKKSEKFQLIKNPAKIKRMKKKQLRMLEKRDVLGAV